MQTEVHNPSNRSRLFTAFNVAVGMAKDGRLDRSRVNRALGVAQSKRPLPYGATASFCSCKDALNRKVTCKHSIAASLREVAQ